MEYHFPELSLVNLSTPPLPPNIRRVTTAHHGAWDCSPISFHPAHVCGAPSHSLLPLPRSPRGCERSSPFGVSVGAFVVLVVLSFVGVLVG